MVLHNQLLHVSGPIKQLPHVDDFLPKSTSFASLIFEAMYVDPPLSGWFATSKFRCDSRIWSLPGFIDVRFRICFASARVMGDSKPWRALPPARPPRPKLGIFGSSTPDF